MKETVMCFFTVQQMVQNGIHIYTSIYKLIQSEEQKSIQSFATQSWFLLYGKIKS